MYAALAPVGTELCKSADGLRFIDVELRGDRQLVVVLNAIEDYVTRRNDGPALVALDGQEKVSRTYGTSLGTYALGLVLVLLLIWAFSYALTEKNPDGLPTTPTSTTPQQSIFGSSVVPEPSQATSSDGSKK